MTLAWEDCFASQEVQGHKVTVGKKLDDWMIHSKVLYGIDLSTSHSFLIHSFTIHIHITRNSRTILNWDMFDILLQPNIYAIFDSPLWRGMGWELWNILCLSSSAAGGLSTFYRFVGFCWCWRGIAWQLRLGFGWLNNHVQPSYTSQFTKGRTLALIMGCPKLTTCKDSCTFGPCFCGLPINIPSKTLSTRWHTETSLRRKVGPRNPDRWVYHRLEAGVANQHTRE